MRIMATSDLHGNLEGLDPRGADVVVLAGAGAKRHHYILFAAHVAGQETALERLAIGRHAHHVASRARDGDVERGLAVAQSHDVFVARQTRWHKGAEFNAGGIGLDAGNHAQHHGGTGGAQGHLVGGMGGEREMLGLE